MTCSGAWVSSLWSSALPTYLMPLFLSQGSSETSLPHHVQAQAPVSPCCLDGRQSLPAPWIFP